MRNPWKVTSFALAGLLAFAVGREALVPSVSADVQPKMRSALGSLKSAEQSLTEATVDKGGHRAAALKLTRDAIEQVQRGIKFDNRH
ncbi:MAG: hypothetical protein WKG01_16465 [Kofleriaceae bacterium]